MSTECTGKNTYIGMRYVPIIAGAWNAETEYEPLTIVTHGGNSYTSKSYVPKGIEPSNATYWALTGNYNAQLDQCMQESAEAINGLNSLKETLAKSYIVVIGDSFSNWEKTGQPYWYTYVQKAVGATDAKVYASPGTGLLAPQTPTFLEQANTAKNDATYDHNMVKKVYILGGCNDYSSWNSDTNLYKAQVNEIMGVIQAAFPKAETTWLINGWGQPEMNYGHVSEYYHAIYDACANKAVVKNVSATLQVSPNTLENLPDRHPSSEGSRILAMNAIQSIPFPDYPLKLDQGNQLLNLNGVTGANITDAAYYDFINGGVITVKTVFNLALPITTAAVKIPLNWRIRTPVYGHATIDGVIKGLTNFDGPTFDDSNMYLNTSTISDNNPHFVDISLYARCEGLGV